jgi:hypothetical protein
VTLEAVHAASSFVEEGTAEGDGTAAGHGGYYSAMPLNPMTTFDPDEPCRVHDRLNDTRQPALDADLLAR